ncbi:LLM class flavin-dependent oxidoreductase [Amycolatopsis jejuensis]|uniref:LLM class flavin-dependent oxidoreductase n=1 Tax=Amycolatopsis jejuensis TaxID=330084 RepID=UPI0005275670|nr:LLM class flavin-dependent oxidoreductase [Amycolatopsis jejuensis]
MQFGLNVIQTQPVFDTTIRQALLAESLCYDVVWMHEHHSKAAPSHSSPMLGLALLAGRTRRIRLGTNMLLLPLHCPLTVAEESAELDAISGGRFILGIAAGYTPHEFEAFGVSLTDRGRRMDEGLRLIRGTWDGTAVHHAPVGSDAFALFPPPRQTPGPPIYVGGLARAAIRRAALLGDGYVLSSGTAADELPARIAAYHDALTAVAPGTAPRLPLALNRVVHVVGSRAEKEEAERFFSEALLSTYVSLRHDDVLAREQEFRRTPAEVAGLHFVIGEPGECIERFAEFAELGIGHVNCLMNFGGPDPERVEKSIVRLGEDVLQAFA